LLCLLAFSLRVFRLDFQPIWFDEDLAYQRATVALDVSLASMAGSPLYYVILRGWADLAGSSLYALRFFSPLCGTLAVPLIYQVARRLLSREAALATMALAVFAPFYLYYSQEARTYSLTLVRMLISMHAFLHYKDGMYTTVPAAGEDVKAVSVLPDGSGFASGVGSLLRLTDLPNQVYLPLISR
jgi:4-amino-4-deoxy-L-arabinose transferase-like glycosyltransferase